MPGQILACGGVSLGSRFDDLVLERSGPGVCFVPTASTHPETRLVSFYESFAGRAEASHVVFNPWPRQDLREHVLAQDAIYVAGGSTANMLAVWRVHGFDTLLREAWERGALLCGWSAGMICWFEAGVTDSFGPELEGMRDLLGFLPGSACPHYDGEKRRRDVYRQLVADGFPAGYAADDGAALHFVGTELREVIAVREGARAYRVEPGAETRSNRGFSSEEGRCHLHRERQREDDRRPSVSREARRPLAHGSPRDSSRGALERESRDAQGRGSSADARKVPPAASDIRLRARTLPARAPLHAARGRRLSQECRTRDLMSRVSVITTASGNGGTTFSRELAARLGVPFHELDALFWKPDWIESSDDEFRARVEPLVGTEAWVIDGSYQSILGDFVFRHADAVVWLDQPMRVWLPRLVRRTFARVIRREDLWGTNRESIWNVLFSRDSLLLFTLRHYRRRRRIYPERLAPFNLIRLRTPAEIERFLTSASERPTAK